MPKIKYLLVAKARNGGREQYHICGNLSDYETLSGAKDTAYIMVNDGSKEEIFIVEIIGKVHRTSPPVIWTDLKDS